MINFYKTNYYEQISEYMLFKITAVLMIIMLFYMYIKAIFPFLPFLKDFLILLSFFVVFLSIASSGFRISKPNYLDKIVLILFIYLMFQFIYTYLRTNNIFVTYYGFRLTYLPIFIYFIIKSIKNKKYRVKIDKIIITSLVIGCFITIIESLSLQMGIISPELLATILDRKPMFLSGFTWTRVYGVVGTPHITGVYNAILFSLLLFSIRKPLINLYYVHVRPFVKYKLTNERKFLLIVSSLAVLISTSRTAWTILFLLLLIYPFINKKINFAIILKYFVLIIILLMLLIYFLRENLETSYLGFLIVYSAKFFESTFDVIQKSPFIGFGFEVGDYSKYLDISNVSVENLTAGTELFLGQIFRMLGLVGIILYLCIFLVVPFVIIISNRLPRKIKIIAAPTLVIGISFGHYNPFESPTSAMCAWYFLALLSNEISFNNQLKLV